MKFKLPKIKFPKTSTSDPAMIYNSSNIFLRGIYLRRLKICCKLIKKRYQKALDLGTGSGILIPSLLENSEQVVGIDIHKKLSEVKNALLVDANLTNFELIQGDVYQLPIQNTIFDLVIAVSLLEHLPNVDRVLKEARRVLKDDGTFILGMPLENRVTRLRYRYLVKKYGVDAHLHVTPYQEILDALKKYFRIVDTKKLIPFMPISTSMYCALECEPRPINPKT